MYNFAAGIAQSKAMSESKALFALIMAPSGGGKSYVMGTLGVKTLYLYVSGEAHGARSAIIEGGDSVVPYCLDFVDGKQLDPDATLQHLRYILTNTDLIKENGFEAVAIDGAAELEGIIRISKEFAKKCLNGKGVHDNWLETEVTKGMFRTVTECAKNLQRETGAHILMSSILDVKAVDENGGVTEAAPKLRGAGVADFLLRQFDEVLVIGRMQRDETVAHRFQFMTKMSKVSKDVAGGGVKLMNFSPRITGCKADELPATLPADLKLIRKMKETGRCEVD